MRTIREFLKNRRIQGAGAYFLVQVFQSGIALVLIPLYTRYLVPSEYGIVQTCAAIVTAINVFGFLCVQEGAYFALMRKEPDAPKQVAATLRFELLVAAIALPVFVLIALTWRERTVAGVSLFPYVAGVAFAAAANQIVTTYLLALQAVEEIRRCAVISFVIFASITSVQVFLLVGPELEALSYIYAQVIGSGLAAVFAAAALIRRYGFATTREHTRKVIRFSAPLVPHNAAHWARGNVDRVMLSSVTSTAQTGVYGMAATYASLLTMALDAFRLVNNPRFFSLIPEPEANRSQITSILPVSLAALSALAIVMSLLAKDIFHLFLAPDYWDAYRYVPLLSVAVLAFGVYINVVNVLFHKSRTALISAATVGGSLIGIGATWLLVSRYGPWGSAAGILIVNVAITSFVVVLVQRETRLPWPWLPTLLCVCAPLVCYVGGMIDQALVVRLGVALGAALLLGAVAFPYARRLVGSDVS
ncbi:MAG TPA: oligosaccharide flippase family protein [Kofleriaceae bacterium]